MKGNQLVTLGVLGAVGYYLYKNMGSLFPGKGEWAPPRYPRSQADCGSGETFVIQEAGPPYCAKVPIGTSTLPGVAPPPPTTPMPPTPTVTAPPTPASTNDLQAAAQSQGLPTMMNPDGWNWVLMNVAGRDGFDLDPAFGSVGAATRASLYTAAEFLEIARGQRKLPVVVDVSVPESYHPLTPTAALPPELLPGTEPQVALYGLGLTGSSMGLIPAFNVWPVRNPLRQPNIPYPALYRRMRPPVMVVPAPYGGWT